MKTEYDKAEIKALLRILADEHSMARLVNPETQKVCDPSGAESEAADCCRLWGRCDRCENCTSLRALEGKGRCYKLEIMNQHIFWVVSQYLEADGKPCVLEMVDDVTDKFILDSDQQDEISRLIRSYNHLLITDSMTDIYNRRFLDESFLPSLRCCGERGLIVNLALMDFDDFKLVNDAYGHQAGDALLKDATGFWKRHFNSRVKEKERLVVRFGGDEILIITCGEKGDVFRREIAEYYGQMRKVCYYGADTQIPFSITFGIASSEELPAAWEWDELFNLADHRMYEAKTTRKRLRDDPPK